MTFKVGDKVRYINGSPFTDGTYVKRVVSVLPKSVEKNNVKLDDDFWYKSEHLSLVTTSADLRDSVDSVNHPSDNPFLNTATKIGKLVSEKNKAYGDSFNQSGNFLELLYPNGIKPEQYTDMLGIVRVFDKMMRIANRKDAFGENPWEDIAGYSILKTTIDATEE